MTDRALEIQTKPIDCFAAYDATIQVDWLIGIGGHMEKRKIGFVGFYLNYNENESIFRERVFKAYDAINETYENWCDGEIQTSVAFCKTDVNM